MGLGERVKAWFSSSPVPAPEQARWASFSGYSGFRVTDQLLNHRASRQGLAVDRAAALSVPAVLRGRNMICSISTLPLQAVDASNHVQQHPLLDQTDPNTANEVMLAMTTEDLIFDAVSWWRVTGRDEADFPAAAVRYSPDQVSLDPPKDYLRGRLPSELPTVGVVWMEGKAVPYRDVIRFDSPNPALLVAGERAIRRAITLDDAADLYATNRRMRGYFAPREATVDPGDDDKIQDALDDWTLAREKRLDGYVPAALVYNTIQDPTPAETQIIQQQQRADLAIANAIGIDPEDLGINTTSRTYQNATDRRRDRINDVLAPYMRAITGRLSMGDVTRKGVKVRFDLGEYLRADPKTRAEVQQIYHDMGATDAAEVREDEGRPPRAIEAPRPPVPNTQISAIPAGAQ